MIIPAVPDPPQIEKTLWEGFSRTDLAFDIGANCGQTFDNILKFAKRIEAFEPSFEAIEWMAMYLRQDENINVHKLAVSSHTGEITLYAIPDKINTGQLVSDVDHMEWHVEGQYTGRPVPAISLDDAVKEFGNPGFIKIDVEGHEWEILRPAFKTLDRVRPEFLVEIHDAWLGRDIRTMFEDYEYNMEVVRHPNYEVDSDLYWNHYWVKAFPETE